MTSETGRGCIAPLILNFGNGLSLVFTLTPLNTRIMRPQYAIKRRLDGQQRFYGRCEQEKALLLLSVCEHRTVRTDCTPRLIYLSMAQYCDDVSLWSAVGYSLIVALSVDAAECYYRESLHRRQCLLVFGWNKRKQFFVGVPWKYRGQWGSAPQVLHSALNAYWF